MIITLIDTKINIHNKFYCSLDTDLLNKLQSFSLLRRKTIEYKFFINNQERQLSCPLLKFPQNKKVVLWPSIKIPYRRYPVHVYIYAVTQYISSKMSMREVALKVRKKFGLKEFSHSTISRVLKKLSLNALELLSIVSNWQLTKLQLAERPRWNSSQISIYKQLLLSLGPVLADKGVEFCSSLNYQFYNKTQRFLI